MNSITQMNSANLTMSSREIAELCEKRHDHVLRDIRTMLTQLYGDEAVQTALPDKDATEAFFDKMGWGIDSPKLGNQRNQGIKVSRDGRGFISEISLDYSHTMTLISGYKVQLRKAIIDKWQELEEKAHNPIAALSRVDLLKLALDSEEKRLELETKVSQLAPKALALDRISTADGSVCPTDAAKNLGARPKKLFAWLQEHKWLYRRVGCSHYCAYQDKIQAGLMEQKFTTVTRSDGTEKSVEQARITAKGLARLSEVVELEQLA
jgi:phage antirepressor YoqD-like protein